jgi:MarR family transcriptional regulator, organic hydroperoxide resistance regulator
VLPDTVTPPPAGPSDLLALDRQVCFALAVAAREVIALYKPLLEPLGLTHPQYLVMLALWEDSPLRVADLAARVSLEPATLSPLLKRLEQRGMVVRDRDPRDERALAVRLTPAGADVRAAAEAIPVAILSRLGMEVGELEALRDRLTEVVAAARAVPTAAHAAAPPARAAADRGERVSPRA